MPFSLAMIGAGQFAGQFTKLWALHPGVTDIQVTDLQPDRAEKLVAEQGLAGTFASFEEALASDVDAVAIFTQRWTHAPLVLAALEAGKHVYSAVPMGITTDEIAAIVAKVESTGLIYMMGETSYYNPMTVLARQRIAAGLLGRVFYAEGDYVHDMDLGFYDAYEYSGGENWKATASYPPMLYPTHSIGGVLGAMPGHAVSVSCIGDRDQSNDGVFDREISMFDNDFSNATALFELSGGGSFRTNEFRRVGYPARVRESKFSFYGTEAVVEQSARQVLWETRHSVEDLSDLVRTHRSVPEDDPSLADISPDLRASFISGTAPVHNVARLPVSFKGERNGHEGSHHFLVDDFARAVNGKLTPPVNAWVAARFTGPGVIAHQSARNGGERLPIPDLGRGPVVDTEAFESASRAEDRA